MAPEAPSTGESSIADIADLGGRAASAAGVPQESIFNNLVLAALEHNQNQGLGNDVN